MKTVVILWPMPRTKRGESINIAFVFVFVSSPLASGLLEDTTLHCQLQHSIDFEASNVLFMLQAFCLFAVTCLKLLHRWYKIVCNTHSDNVL